MSFSTLSGSTPDIGPSIQVLWGGDGRVEKGGRWGRGEGRQRRGKEKRTVEGKEGREGRGGSDVPTKKLDHWASTRIMCT